MSELIKKMLETYPGAAFPDNEEAFATAAEKLGFSEPAIQDGLVELRKMIVEDEALDTVSGGGWIPYSRPPTQHGHSK